MLQDSREVVDAAAAVAAAVVHVIVTRREAPVKERRVHNLRERGAGAPQGSAPVSGAPGRGGTARLLAGLTIHTFFIAPYEYTLEL